MLITVLTPTFNRARTLGDVYESLLTQRAELEWVVVDDGSRDGTRGLIEGLAHRAPFPVRYTWQPNAGKHVAVNRGVAAARGALVALLDSDDTLTAGALDRLVRHWEQIPDRRGYAGVTGLCVDETGVVTGGRFPADVVDATWHEMRYRHRVRGEKWGLLSTEILRAHPFPDDRGFVSECVVWRRIGTRYRTRYVNDAVRVYRSSGPDQLTRRPFAQIAAGVATVHAQTLNEDIGWLGSDPATFTRSAVQLSRGLFHLRTSLWRQARLLNTWRGRALWAAALPAGWMLYRLDTRRR